MLFKRSSIRKVSKLYLTALKLTRILLSIIKRLISIKKRVEVKSNERETYSNNVSTAYHKNSPKVLLTILTNVIETNINIRNSNSDLPLVREIRGESRLGETSHKNLRTRHRSRSARRTVRGNKNQQFLYSLLIKLF